MKIKLFVLASVCGFFFFNAAYTAESQELLTLTKAIETALRNNTSINSMYKAVEQAQYLHSADAHEWLPVLSTDYSFTAFAEKPALKFKSSDIPELEIEGSDLEMPVAEHTSFFWATHLKMPLYTGNALQYQETLSRLGIDVAKVRLLEAKADLIQEVTTYYLNVLKLQNYVEVVAQNLTRLREHESSTEKYYKVGLVAKNALLEIQVRRVNVQQDLIAARKELRVAKMTLNLLMGMDIATAFVFDTNVIFTKTTYSLEQCFELAKKNNPSLIAFECLKKRAEKVVELEKTQTRPKVNADLSFSRHGKNPVVTGDDYLTNNIFMAMIVAHWDVFDWFKSADRSKARDKDLGILLDTQKMSTDRVILDIRQTYLNMEAAEHKLRAAKQEIKYAKENYRISKIRYDEHVARSTEVNDALQLLKQAQFHYYSTLYEFKTALAKLERTIGLNIKPEYCTEEKKG